VSSSITAAIEVVTVPVADVDRAVRFYVDRLGFTLDVDYAPRPSFRVVQLTPPGSGCSIQFGIGVTDGEPGSLRTTYLVVDDLQSVQAELAAAGVPISAIRHKTPQGAWDGSFADGLDPDRADYASFADFADPDGNTWTLQERGYQHG
jgi:catechol 2,3-dioxygenase-like lactoylglutathione lyase family enzyme